MSNQTEQTPAPIDTATDANSNELPDTAVSIGGIIGDDWAAECVQRAARYSAEGI